MKLPGIFFPICILKLQARTLTKSCETFLSVAWGWQDCFLLYYMDQSNVFLHNYLLTTNVFLQGSLLLQCTSNSKTMFLYLANLFSFLSNYISNVPSSRGRENVRLWKIVKRVKKKNPSNNQTDLIRSSVTRLGDSLDFGQLFIAFGNN